MTRSLRRTFTHRGKTTTATARELHLGRKTPAGMAFPVSAPSEQAFRRHVLDCICPFCGRGPYKALAIHTNRAHGVDKKELRDRAGLFYSTSITSPAYHDERVAISTEQYRQGKTGIRNGVRGERKRLSAAAVQLQKKKSALVSTQTRRANGRAAGAARLSAAKDRDATWVARWREGALLSEIADESGVAPDTVRRALKRAHVWENDGHARRGARLRGIYPASLKAWHAARAAS